jgi:hypothetical protein
MDITKVNVRYSYYFLFFLLVSIIIFAIVSVELLIIYSFNFYFIFIASIFFVICSLFIGNNIIAYKTLKAIYQDIQDYTANSILNDVRPFKPFIETERYIIKSESTGLGISFKYHQLSEFIISYIGYLKKYKIFKKNMDNKLKADFEKIFNKELKQFFHKTYYLRDIIQKKNKNLEIHIGGGDWVTDNPAFHVFSLAKISGVPLRGALDLIYEFDKYLNSNNSLKKL